MPSEALPEGTVTVLSTDLVGSTALNQRLGDQAATAIEREVEELALEQIAKQRGIVVKETGDGLMAAFQSARRAVACAREIQCALSRRNRMSGGQDVQLRIGLHTGEVISEDGDLHGETVILAKRVEEAATPGSIFASDTVYGVLGTARSKLEDRGQFELKGIAIPWQLYEVPWSDGEATGVLGRQERSPFVGRIEQRRRLLEAAERARDGAGSLVFVAGEVGVGKTRLIEEVSEEAVRIGLRPLKGHCVDQQGAAPYLPWIEQIEAAARATNPELLRQALGESAPEIAKLMPALRTRFPDIPDAVALPPEQERRYLLNAVADFVERAAGGAPLLLVFEDLHWADEPTLLLLRHLAQRVGQMSILVVGTYRHTELKSGRPLAAMLPELLSQRLGEEIMLPRLEESEVTTLLHGRAGQAPPPELVSLLYFETEGNPFFIEEVFRHLHESGKLFDASGEWRPGIQISDTEVPRSVSLVIGQRLERVSDTCRKILTIAALVGRTFRFDLVASVEGVDEDELLDALEEAMSATLVEDVSVEREARYAFVHEQIRQTLLSLLSFARRQRLHLRTANAMETLHGRDADHYASEIAHHLYQAGSAVSSSERTAHWLIRASQRALESLAFEEALRDLEAAHTVLPPDESETRTQIIQLRASALRGLGRIDEATAALADAVELAPPGPARDSALQQRAQLRLDLFKGKQAMEDIDALLANARDAGDRQREVELLLMRSRGLYIRSLDEPGIAAEMRACYEEAYAFAKQAGDKRAMVQALLPTTWFMDYWADYRPTAIANNQEAMALALELGDEELQLEVSTAALRTADQNVVASEAERLLKLLEERRDPLRLKEHYFWLMWHYWMRCKLEKCVEICDKGIALAHDLGIPPVQYPTIKALALIDMGRMDDAWSSLREEVADDEHPFGRCVQQLGETVWLEAAGAYERAAASGKEVLEEAGRLSRTWMQSSMIDLLSEISARPGAGGGKGELRDWIDAKSAEIGFGARTLASAHLHLAAGEFEAARELANKSVTGGTVLGQLRGRLAALFVEIRSLAALERWDELLERAEATLAEPESAGFKTRLWKMHLVRATARQAKGDTDGAASDRQIAREIFDEIAASISDGELRNHFQKTFVELEETL